MPELPEAETICRYLAGRIVGDRIVRVRLDRRDIIRQSVVPFRSSLTGATLRAIRRRGKRPVIELDNAHCLIIGLGMTGQLLVQPKNTRPAPHTHLRLILDRDDLELRFRDTRRFGGIWLVPSATIDRGTTSQIDDPSNATGSETCPKPLPAGLEPLDMSPREFRDLFRGTRPVKALLLDQNAIAGLGNIYCDEALHRARIHPQTIVTSLDRPHLDRLRRSIRAVLDRDIRDGGTTLRDFRSPNGDPGRFQTRHRVYGKADQPCPRCGAPIQRTIVASRSTHFCPSCQTNPDSPTGQAG